MRDRCTAALLATVAAMGVGSCTPEEVDAPSHPPVAVSSAGMVVSGSAYATEAGIRMLASGGNAVDAAVAAAFALTVAEPTQSGLGGRTQVLIRLADGIVVGVDGTTEVPAGYEPAEAPTGEHGHTAIGIPGTVAALAYSRSTYGTLPLETVMAPAIEGARRGIVLSEGEAARIAEFARELVPGSAIANKLLDTEGRPLAAGTHVRQADLARTLEAISRGGPSAFYRGEIARAIAADMAANGGYVTLDDLATYRARDSQIGSGEYRGHTVFGSYLPASGVTVIEILQILDRFMTPSDEAEWGSVLAEALLAGFEDREIAEPMTPGAATAWLTSDSLAARRAAEIRGKLDGAFDAAHPDTVPGPEEEPPYTTHVSVADTFGNVVALTQSLGPSGGARVVTAGLGFLYASTLGGYLAGGGPGYRPWSSQAPLVVVRNGTPSLVMGGAGGRRILSALVATLTRVLDQGIDLEAAMDAPRLHPSGGALFVEAGWDGAMGLAERGYRVEERGRAYFARLNVVQFRDDQTFLGVGDPRWTKSAAAGPNQ